MEFGHEGWDVHTCPCKTSHHVETFCNVGGRAVLKVETAPGEGAKPHLPNSQCSKAWGSFAEVVLQIACSSVW